MIARSFDDAVEMLLARRRRRYVSDDAPGAALGRAFVIGGATLYDYVLTHTSPAWRLAHLLVTRIYEPADLDAQCDVFLREFRSERQAKWEASAAADEACDAMPHGPWRLADADEHAQWLPPDFATPLRAAVDDRGTALVLQLWHAHVEEP